VGELRNGDRKINKVTASQDDDTVGVFTKNTLNKVAPMGLRPGLAAPNRDSPAGLFASAAYLAALFDLLPLCRPDSFPPRCFLPPCNLLR
jgi:hypothetical protein